MKKKELTSMPILTQKEFDNCKREFTVNKDFNLNGAKIVVPRQMTMRFEEGSINNGTLVLNDNLLEGMEDGSINARIEGSVRNETIYTSTIGGIDNLANLILTGKTIKCNVPNDVLNNTIVLNDTSTILTTTFDGMDNIISSNVNFFEIYGQSNIIIQNFHAIANSSSLEFERMVTTAANVTNVNFYGNIVDGFKLGISLNNDSDTYTVSYCTVSNNHVYNCQGSTSGSGYGIHMANARNCDITGNEIVNCERHAIYHAYGENNTICNNIIRNHCQNLTTYPLLAALEIGRKSKNVTVRYNTFVNCNNICLLIYSPLAANDGDDGLAHPWRYGRCENIYVRDNSFYKGTLTGSIGNLPFIYIGVEATPYSILSAQGKVVVNVEIRDNLFDKVGGVNQKCIKVHQCEQLYISGNRFQLGLPSSSSQNDDYLVIDIPSAYVQDNHVQMTIIQNRFIYNDHAAKRNLYLMGENMSQIDSSVNSYFTIAWTSNTLQNQIIGGNTMYNLSKYTPGNNFVIS